MAYRSAADIKRMLKAKENAAKRWGPRPTRDERTAAVAQAYESLNRQPGVADWHAYDLYQFLMGERLTREEARELVADMGRDVSDLD